MDNLYSKKRSAQYRGPTTSDDYNARVEENYKDLLHLANRIGITDEGIRKANRHILHNLRSLSQTLVNAGSGINYILNDNGTKYMYSVDENVIDTARFDDTSFAVASVDRCSSSRKFRQITLPMVSDTSASKLKFEDDNGVVFLPSTFEAFATGVDGTLDDSYAFVNTSDVADAIVGGIGSAWERNVIVTGGVTPGTDGAEVDVYIKIPEDVSVVAESNCIVIDPYPMLGVSILSIKVTTAQDPLLRESDGYVSLNPDNLYEGNNLAIGYVPPGAYEDDTIVNAPATRFYFDPKSITAIKITLAQYDFVEEHNNQKIFTYGMNEFDVRYDKFLDSGKIMYRYDAADGETISTAPDLTPLIYNVSLADIPYVFSYRTIWETAVDSEVYTTTPVPFSEKIWYEITLNKTTGGTTPVLSALRFN